MDDSEGMTGAKSSISEINWNKHFRTTGQSLVAGIGGGIAVHWYTTPSNQLADFVSIMVIYLIVVVASGLYEYIYPPKDG